MPSRARAELMDDMVYAYVQWQEECMWLEDAYCWWASRPVADRELAFVAYRAALDREQQACSVYAENLNRLSLEQGPESGSRGWPWRLLPASTGAELAGQQRPELGNARVRIVG